MATGASKAKREAKKQAAAAYYEGLKKFERMDKIKRIDTQGARKLDESMEGNMSGRSKRMARQADKLGREINKHESGFNEKVDKYNDRFDQLQKQMNSKTGNSKGVDFAHDLEPGARKDMARLDRELAQLRAEGASKVPTRLPTGQAQPLDDRERQRAERIMQLEEERDFVDRTSRGINNSYRNLDSLELAYGEMATLAGDVQGYKAGNTPSRGAHPTQEQKMRDALQPQHAFGLNTNTQTNQIGMDAHKENKFDFQNMVKDESSPGANLSKFGKQYEALAQKLQTSVNRDMRMASDTKQANPTGLLASSMVIDPNVNPVAMA